MSFQPPVTKKDVLTAEERFLRFIVFCMALLLVFIALLFVPKLSNFWEGNILWSSGSFLVLISVLQARYFDIKKYSNPNSLMINTSDRRHWVTNMESVVNHLWLFGFLLVGASRWVQI
jgi:hypothetical protein